MQRIRSIRRVSLVTLIVAGVIAAVAIIAAPAFAATAPKPPIVKKYIRYGDGRKKQTIGYNRRHYHQRTYILAKPRAIVLHHTAGADWRSAWWTFDGNSRYSGEKPGVSAQFIIHKDGTIYQTMPLKYRARHCIGMNWVSFGIEFVQEMRAGKDGHWMDRRILKRTKQVKAGLKLVRWLQYRYGIKTAQRGRTRHRQQLALLRRQDGEQERRRRLVLRRGQGLPLAPVGAPAGDELADPPRSSLRTRRRRAYTDAMTVRLEGIHFLVTYRCTYACDHCFVWGSPDAEETMTLAQLTERHRPGSGAGAHGRVLRRR